MSFLNPLALWGPLALAAVALPVIIHLLSRFRPRPMEWAAMELLRRAMVVRARRVRLEDFLLMLLRVLALVAVAFALARPSLTDSTSSWIGNARVGSIVAIDGSFSMAHQPGVTKSRFEEALARAREVFATLSNGDPITLVLLGEQPRVLLRNVGYDRDRVETLLKTLEPLPETLNTEACLEELTRLLSDITAPAKECFLITDAQTSAWGNLSDAANTAITELRKTSTVYFVPVGQQNAENVAVTRLGISSGVLRKGAIARFHAEVRNFGRQEARNVGVKLIVEGVETDKTFLDTIHPGETKTVSFYAPLNKAGSFSVSAVLDGNDPLATDNHRYLIVEVRDSVNILCVDGSPSSEPRGGETGILSLALSAQRKNAADSSETATSGRVNVRVVSPDAFATGDLPSQDIVCLAGVAELTHSQSLGLSDFVRRGGGLIVFLGNKSERHALNGIRGNDGIPLLPAELGETIGEKSGEGFSAADGKAWNLSGDPAEHSVTDVLSRLPREQWTGIRFWRYMKASPRDGSQVLLKLAPSNDPLLIEQAQGRGKVYLFTTSANRDWTDFIVSPAYLMILQQIVMDLTRKSFETPVSMGEKLTFEVPADDPQHDLSVRSPVGDDIQAKIVEQNGLKFAHIDRAEQPGVYAAQVDKRESAGGDKRATTQRIAVNVSTQESDVAVLRDSELSPIVQRLSMRLVNEKQGIRTAVSESRQGRELWRILLVFALIMFLTEAVLARLFTRRVQGPLEVYSQRASAI